MRMLRNISKNKHNNNIFIIVLYYKMGTIASIISYNVVSIVVAGVVNVFSPVMVIPDAVVYTTIIIPYMATIALLYFNTIGKYNIFSSQNDEFNVVTGIPTYVFAPLYLLLWWGLFQKKILIIPHLIVMTCLFILSDQRRTKEIAVSNNELSNDELDPPVIDLEHPYI